MPKKVNFGEFLETWSLRSNQFVENAKIEKLKCNILGDFQILCSILVDKNCTHCACKL